MDVHTLMENIPQVYNIECASWLAENSTGERGGLIVDFLTIMKNVQKSIVVDDSIGTLYLLYKLQIEAFLSMLISLFESNVPSFFSTESTHKVIKEASSYVYMIADHT